ncbi:MAG: hypothetical protein JNM17_07310 [Archangium sp.]|nr:hypothetical protein [Archangium sp.]
MNTLALLVAIASVPSQSALQNKALTDAVLACGLEAGGKVTMGIAIEHGKVKSVRPVFKNVREASVRECVMEVTRGYQFDLTGPERFTIVVAR